MKIGILTFHFAYNYGAMLQAYALSTYLSKCGYDVKIINYFPDELKHLYTLNPFIAASKKEVLGKIKKLPRCVKQFKMFDEFKNNDLLCTYEVRREDLRRCNDLFDIFIVGSDQVWSHKILTDVTPYFLDFAENNKIKMSYAASFGSANISKKYRDMLPVYLENFKAISVREEDAVGLLKNIGIDSEAVIDPVFLLERKEWILLANNNVVLKNKKYIFYYILESNAELDEYVRKRAKEEKCAIVIVHPTCERLSGIREAIYLDEIGPKEFLGLLINAKIVVTNSFHATAFSIMFGIEVMNMGSSERLARVKSLVGKLCSEYNPVEGEIHLSSNFVSMDSLAKLVETSKNFLNNSINEYE